MADLVLRGGRVLVDEGWVDGDLHIADGVVVAACPPDAPELDAAGLLVAPGFVDLQCNGAVGVDVTTDPAGLWEVGARLPAWGVTAWLPTVVTAPAGAPEAALAALAAGPPPGWAGAVPLGLHLEGPFLAPEARGAHPAAHLRPPRLEEAQGWSREAGVAVVTLAPELPGALEVVAALAARGVVVSLGHSRATMAEARAAVDAGATWVTHLFNAMAPLHHREPGLAGVALADPRLRVGLISDGAHVAPEVVGLAQRLLADRLTLVTDAVAALGDGGPAGEPARTRDGTLAGATCPMGEAVANLARFSGCGPAVALRAASAGPAAVLGDPSRGTLRPGARGDVVLLTSDLEVVATVVGGVVLHDRRRAPLP